MENPIRLYIHPQFGLANRLRALASSMVAAKRSNRELVLIWEPDDHCQAEFEELFIPKGFSVVSSLEAAALSKETIQIDCMSINGNDSRRRVDFDVDASVYVKTYCEINSAYESQRLEVEALRSLQIKRSVQQQIDRYDVWNRIGIHVRSQHAGNTKFDFEKAANNWSEDDQDTITFFRSISDYRYFLPELRRIIESQPDVKLFLCADSEETVEAIMNEVGARVLYVEKPALDRSKEAVIGALIDFKLLSQTQMILGSYGSSFSKVAQAMGGQEIRYSGRNFGAVSDPSLIKGKKAMKEFFVRNEQLLNFLRSRLDFVWGEKAKVDYQLYQSKQRVAQLEEELHQIKREP